MLGSYDNELLRIAPVGRQKAYSRIIVAVLLDENGRHTLTIFLRYLGWA
ncbi:hypothetical protein EV130_104186 [Rhizobium azibense]|uniref:Uncharacterized protein n=1 Tax=Rhizobium azibense TaxID=1136135 RepID=A0A4V2VBW9_9HYPH|nr:hypothetical protein EV130_104186 [Rhizobium azibense]